MADPSLSTAGSQPHGSQKRDRKQAAVYPDLTVIPATSSHTQTLILLHGRGGEGKGFGLELLESKTAAGETLQQVFPNVKWIFPTAKKRRAKWYNRAVINQWFDNVPVDFQDEGEVMTREAVKWQLEGLRETAEFLKPIVDTAVKALGTSNVFVGGLSQGCAMAMHFLASYQGVRDDGNGTKTREQALGGFIGMSEWMPYAADMEEIIRPECYDDSGADEDGPFSHSGDEGDGNVRIEPKEPATSIATGICNLVRDNMDLPPIATINPLCLGTPVFLGHGRNDERVKMEKGLRAMEIFKDMGMQVEWKDYDMGH